MEQLRLDNRILIVSQIKQYCSLNKLEYVDFLEDFYEIITSDKDETPDFEAIINVIMDKLKNETLYDTEEEIFHVVSYELDNIYTEDVMKNANKEDLDDVFNFLEEEYYDIFKQYYDKKGYINDDDYDECVLSVFNNYDMDDYVADVLVGKFINDKIIEVK